MKDQIQVDNFPPTLADSPMRRADFLKAVRACKRVYARVHPLCEGMDKFSCYIHVVKEDLKRLVRGKRMFGSDASRCDAIINAHYNEQTECLYIN